jgi:hypothetical protein
MTARLELVMSTPKTKLRRTQKRKGAVVTSAAALDGSTAAFRSGDRTAQDGTFPSKRNHGIPVNEKRAPAEGPATDDPVLLDNLPELIPVTRSELEVIETYLSSLIDQLLLNATADGAMQPVSNPNFREPIRASRPRP